MAANSLTQTDEASDTSVDSLPTGDLPTGDAAEIEQLKRQVAALQAELMQAQRLSSVGAIAASITHEFNNILTTVINYSKMGLRHKDDATRDKAFDKILAAGQRASKITTGMLSYARNRADRQEPMDLVVLAQDVLVLVEKDLQSHRISLETNFPEPVMVMVNPSQIQQVVLNLVINARQAMDEGGSLRVGVRRDDENSFGEVFVKDTGSGIPSEKLPKIFDPFFSTKEADSQGQGGTGLGLSVCRQIIERHRGRIRVESTVGRGTTFTLKLPLAAPIESTKPAWTE